MPLKQLSVMIIYFCHQVKVEKSCSLLLHRLVRFQLNALFFEKAILAISMVDKNLS